MKKEKKLYVITIAEAILFIIPKGGLIKSIIALILSILGIKISKETNKKLFKIINIIVLVLSSLAILSGIILLISGNLITSEIQNLWNE